MIHLSTFNERLWNHKALCSEPCPESYSFPNRWNWRLRSAFPNSCTCIFLSKKKKVKYHINIYYRNDNMLYLPVTCPVASSTSSGVLLSVFKKMPNVLVVLCSTLRAHWDCSQVIQLSSLTDSTLTWTCRTSSGERSLPSILCIIS